MHQPKEFARCEHSNLRPWELELREELVMILSILMHKAADYSAWSL